MNYITAINSFWYSATMNPLSTGQIALWFALMHINNGCNWTEWFQAPNQVLSVLTGMSRSGILKARNELKQRGLIDFRERGTKTTLYTITIVNSKQVSVQDSKQNSEQVGTQDGVQDSMQDIYIKDIEKDKRKNNPPISPTAHVDRFLAAYPLPDIQIYAYQTEIALVSTLMTDNASEQDLITAVENYADSLRRTGKIKEQQFIKHPQNFLRDKTYLQYLPGVYRPPEPRKGKGNQEMMTRDYDFSALEQEILSN